MMKAKNILIAVSIRRAIPDDAEAIEHVHVQTYKTSYRGFLPDDFLDDLKVTEEHIKHMQKHLTDDEIYVAVYQNQIIGFAYLSYPQPGCFEIKMLYILPSYQQCGIGRLLLDAVCSQKTDCYDFCLVWTMKHGTALPFYLAMNFQPTAEEKIWKFDIPLLLLKKKLHS